MEVTEARGSRLPWLSLRCEGRRTARPLRRPETIEELREIVFDGRWRAGVDRGTEPLGAALGRAGVSANQLTIAGVVIAVGAAFAIGSGHLRIGTLLLVASALPDLLDGPVAKAAHQASQRGAFLDSVTDRVVDTLLLGGVAWYLASRHGGQAAVLAFAILGVTFLVSYERAKAESLGLQAKGGIMERAERMIVLGVGLFFGSLLVPLLWVMLVLTSLTALQRFVHVLAQADAGGTATRAAGVEEQGAVAAASPEAPARAWRRGRVDSRWRSWREAAVQRSGRPRRTGAPVGRWRARRRATVSSRSVRAGRGRGERAAGRALGRGQKASARWRMGEALRRRVDGGQ